MRSSSLLKIYSRVSVVSMVLDGRGGVESSIVLENPPASILGLYIETLLDAESRLVRSNAQLIVESVEFYGKMMHF